MKIGIVYKEGSNKAKKVASEVEKYIKDAGHEVLSEKAIKSADYMLSIGGDGTLIHKACEYADLGVPFIGINVGRLGFLTAIEGHEWKLAVDKVFAGDVFISERITLEASIVSSDQRPVTRKPFRAVNEVVVKGVYRVVDLAVALGDEDFLQVAGDGVIVATQTGSTAYSLSSGGPIVDPDLNCFLLTPVNPIGLPIPSVAISPEQEITITVEGGDEISLIIDGQEHTKVAVGDKISVKRGKKNVKFGYFSKGYFSQSLNSKFELAKRVG